MPTPQARTGLRRAGVGLAVAAVMLATTGTSAQADDNSPLERLAAEILAKAQPGQALRVVVTSRTAGAPAWSARPFPPVPAP